MNEQTPSNDLKTIDPRVRDVVVRNLVGQGPYLFVSLRDGEPTALDSGLDGEQTQRILTHLLARVGMELTRAQLDELSVNFNNTL